MRAVDGQHGDPGAHWPGSVLQARHALETGAAGGQLTDGTISRADMYLPAGILQLPDGQILISGYWSRKIFRFNEDGSFAERSPSPRTGCSE